ncbi:unnamed protein product, partial [Timema podura]|nr:unnamed protein product [Timema podura]
MGRSRPPGIYKADYLQELFRKYDDVEDTPSPPDLPDWCREYDDSNVSLVDDDTSHDKNGATSLSKGGKKRKREFQNKNPTFVEGVSGISAITFQPKLGEIQRKVQEFCGWESTGFPGCQPVSMDNSNIRLLHDKPYRVSWKADGTSKCPSGTQLFGTPNSLARAALAPPSIPPPSLPHPLHTSTIRVP